MSYITLDYVLKIVSDSKVFRQNTVRQISQTRLLLETNSQKGAVLKLFPGGVCFWRGLASGVGELDTWQHLVDSPVELASCCPRGGHVAGPATRTDEMLFTEKKILTSNAYNFW